MNDLQYAGTLCIKAAAEFMKLNGSDFDHATADKLLRETGDILSSGYAGDWGTTDCLSCGLSRFVEAAGGEEWSGMSVSWPIIS